MWHAILHTTDSCPVGCHGAMFLSLGHWVSYAWVSHVQRQTQRPKMQWVKHTTILNDDQLNGFPLIWVSHKQLIWETHPTGQWFAPRCECDLPSGSLLKRCSHEYPTSLSSHPSHLLSKSQVLQQLGGWLPGKAPRRERLTTSPIWKLHFAMLSLQRMNHSMPPKCRRQVGFHDWIELQKALRPRSKGGNLSTRGTTWTLFSRWRIIPFRVLSNHHV